MISNSTSQSQQLVLISLDQLKEIIECSVSEAIKKYFKVEEKKHEESSEPALLTRKEVIGLLHITYPTLAKLSKPGGVLNPRYFGKRVLYDRNELITQSNKLQKVLNNKREI